MSEVAAGNVEYTVEVVLHSERVPLFQYILNRHHVDPFVGKCWFGAEVDERMMEEMGPQANDSHAVMENEIEMLEKEIIKSDICFLEAAPFQIFRFFCLVRKENPVIEYVRKRLFLLALPLL